MAITDGEWRDYFLLHLAEMGQADNERIVNLFTRMPISEIRQLLRSAKAGDDPGEAAVTAVGLSRFDPEAFE